MPRRKTITKDAAISQSMEYVTNQNKDAVNAYMSENHSEVALLKSYCELGMFKALQKTQGENPRFSRGYILINEVPMKKIFDSYLGEGLPPGFPLVGGME